MSRLRASLLVAAVLLLGAHLALAVNVAVGSCKPNLPSYPTISAAVAGAPAGSNIEICPGAYYEQVSINQSLNLVGIASGNSSDVVIYPPGSGLTVLTDDFGFLVAPIVAVVGSAVKISNVTVDGTGNGVACCSTWLPGIFYGDSASGTVNGVTVRNLSDFGLGTGIWASSAVSGSITIENSNFHDIDDSSVIAEGSLNLTAKGNAMEACCFNAQLFVTSINLTGNFVSSSFCCTAIQGSSPGTITGNTITNPNGLGILTYKFGGGLSVTKNTISNVLTGITAEEGGDVYSSNIISKAGIAVELGCNAPTVTGNTIDDATTGLDSAPAIFSGSNKFNSVTTIRTGGCANGPRKQEPGKPGPMPGLSR